LQTPKQEPFSCLNLRGAQGHLAAPRRFGFAPSFVFSRLPDRQRDPHVIPFMVAERIHGAQKKKRPVRNGRAAKKTEIAESSENLISLSA